MACKEEYQKWKELSLLFWIANANWEAAERNAYLAMSAMGATCFASLLSFGAATPFCVTAIGGTALATSEAKRASD